MTMRTRAVCLSAVILLAFAASASGDIMLTLGLKSNRFNHDTLSYYCETQLSVNSDPTIQTILVTSPGGIFTGSYGTGLPPTTPYFPVYDDFSAALNGDWQMAIDNGSAVTNYTFTVTSTITEAQFPTCDVDSPVPGPQATNPPAFTFHMPGSAGQGEFYIVQVNPFATIYDNTLLDPSITSVPYHDVLPGGDYYAEIQVWAGLMPGFDISTPVDNDANVLPGFSCPDGAPVELFALNTFSVTDVPEPASLALLGLGLPLLLKLRRRK